MAAVLLPGLVLAAVTATTRVGPWGDQAVIQLATDRAARLGQLLGPYSRFGWSHPGPLYFYLLALPYRVLGGTGRALAVATVVLAVAWALATVWVVGRLAGRTAARWGAVVVLVQIAALGPGVVAEVWNPVAIIGPCGLFLVACAGLATGRWWAALVAVAAGSFLVETDVSTGLVVAALGLAAVVLAALSTRRRAGGPNPGGRNPDGLGGVGPGGPGPARLGPLAAWAGCALTLGVVLWAAPIYQQFTGHPGNLGSVLAFFRAGHPGHPAGAAARAVAGALWPPLAGRLEAGPPGPAASGAVLAAFGLVAAGLVAGGRSRLVRALGGLATLAAAAGVASAMRATGPLYAYLVEWLTGAGAALVLAALIHVGAGRRPPARAGLAAVAAAVSLAGLALADPPGPQPGGAQVDALWAALAPRLAAGHVAGVRVDVGTPSRWPWAAGLIVALAHHGYRVSAQPSWLFLFGPQFRPGTRAPGAVVTVSSATPGTGPAPSGRLIATAGATRCYLAPAPG